MSLLIPAEIMGIFTISNSFQIFNVHLACFSAIRYLEIYMSESRPWWSEIRRWMEGVACCHCVENPHRSCAIFTIYLVDLMFVPILLQIMFEKVESSYKNDTTLKSFETFLVLVVSNFCRAIRAFMERARLLRGTRWIRAKAAGLTDVNGVKSQFIPTSFGLVNIVSPLLRNVFVSFLSECVSSGSRTSHFQASLCLISCIGLAQFCECDSFPLSRW